MIPTTERLPSYGIGAHDAVAIRQWRGEAAVDVLSHIAHFDDPLLNCHL